MSETPKNTSERIIVRSAIDHNSAADTPATSITIGVCLSDWEYINKVSVDTEGVSLQELSEYDTRRAYKIARMTLAHLVQTTSASGLRVNGPAVANKDTATPAELAAMGKTSIDRILPDEDVTAFNFDIGVYPTDEDVEMFGVDPNAIMPIVDMRSEPSGFAF